MSWLSKIFGGARDLVNPSGLDEQQVAFLHKDLSKLDQSLGERALRYVVDDEDGEVLLALAGSAGGGQALDLTCARKSWGGKKKSERADFLGSLDLDKAELALRLARVYEAASRQDRNRAPVQPATTEWLLVYVEEALGAERYSYPPTRGERRVDAKLVEEMLRLDEQDTAQIARAALLTDPNDYTARYGTELLANLVGFAQSASRHPDVVREALASPARTKVAAIELLRRQDFDFTPFLSELVGLAVGSAKTAREAVDPVMSVLSARVVPLVRARAAEGGTDERAQALRLLARIDLAGSRAFLEERRSEESSKRVLEVLDQLLQSSALPPEGSEAEPVELPPLEDVALDAPLTREVLAAFSETCRKRNETVQAHYEKHRGQSPWMKKPVLISDADVARAFESLQTLDLREAGAAEFQLPAPWPWQQSDGELLKFLQRPELGLVHFVRLLRLLGEIAPAARRRGMLALRLEDSDYVLGYQFDRYCRAYRKSRTPAFGLRELAHVLSALGVDPDLIGTNYLVAGRWRQDFHWEDAAVWPYFYERSELLEEVFEVRPSRLQIQSWWRPDLQREAYKVLALLPSIPPSLVGRIWETALGTAKSERLLAQEALASVAGKVETIVTALASGKQEVRATAAEWLGRLRAPEAVPALEKALAKEKRDVPKGAMLTALEELGVPIERYLDRDGLVAEAEKGLAKGIPEALAWFPFDLLPQVHWRDTGERVSPDVVTWFLVQSFRLKSPEPGPILRRYAASFEPDEAEELGRFALDAWIAEDTRLPAPEELQAKCRAQAKQQLKWATGWTEEQLYRRLVDAARNEPLGSATRSKGVLAVAGAMAGARAAAPVEQYLKRWYGLRAAQSKALLQMLAWIEAPSAIQLLLSVANRFRTAGIRKEAERLVALLAERRGWTVSELADRTIPWAGFERGDEGRAELVLDFGPRAFRARLDDELRVVVENEFGKTVKNLPAPAKGDDPEKAKKAKKQLATARKEIKKVAGQQRERLMEAMCTQRTWSYADWRTFLLEHPVVGRYCQRFVWLASAPGAPAPVTFRPLEDGSLTNVEDEEVRLAPEATVRLAHDANLERSLSQAWLDHLRDYEVAPLFQQLGRGLHELAESEKEKTEVADFEGHLLEAFALRGQATKLGYTRGAAEDGGWFYTYHKHFPSLELETVIEFSGSPLPEENRTVALQRLWFVPKPIGETPSYFAPMERLQLDKVPAVLLSEAWNDLRSMAELGSGHDPNWEKKIDR